MAKEGCFSVRGARKYNGHAVKHARCQETLAFLEAAALGEPPAKPLFTRVFWPIFCLASTKADYRDQNTAERIDKILIAIK